MINFLTRKSKWGFEYCEDSMTSLVFESLTLFAPEDLWSILRYACQLKDYYIPGNLTNIVFWPHWPAEGTNNSSYVEPDVFMEFENLSIIIEVKKNGVTSQNRNQWHKEIVAYHNEYPNHEKNLIVVAVNGNSSNQSEQIDGVNIYKTSWYRLCDAVNKHNSSLSKYHKEWVDKSFKLIGVVPYSAISTWLDEYEFPKINHEAINSTNNIFSLKNCYGI